MKTLSLVIIFFVSSFNAYSQISIDTSFIRLLTKAKDWEKKEDISPVDIDNLFAKGKNDTILVLSNRMLEAIYNSGSFKMDYHCFLTEVLNQRLILDSCYISTSFLIDKRVAEEYKKNNFAAFFYKYCSYINISYPDRFCIKKELSINRKQSVMYFLFINNYITSLDDYAGYYQVLDNSVYYNSIVL